MLTFFVQTQKYRPGQVAWEAPTCVGAGVDAGGALVGMRRGKGGTRSTAPTRLDQPGNQKSTFCLEKLFRLELFDAGTFFSFRVCTTFGTVRSGSRPSFKFLNFFFSVLVNVRIFLFCSREKLRPSEVAYETGIPHCYS